MQPPPSFASEVRSYVARAGGLRKVLVNGAAAIVLGCSLYVGVINTVNEWKIVFHEHPREAPSALLDAQIDEVRRVIPKGEWIIYLMEQPDVWRFGIWKRSLFPDYTILPVASSQVLQSDWVKSFLARNRVRWVVISGSCPQATGWKMTLPEYPEKPTTTLTKLGDYVCGF